MGQKESVRSFVMSQPQINEFQPYQTQKIPPISQIDQLFSTIMSLSMNLSHYCLLHLNIDFSQDTHRIMLACLIVNCRLLTLYSSNLSNLMAINEIVWSHCAPLKRFLNKGWRTTEAHALELFHITKIILFTSYIKNAVKQ